MLQDECKYKGRTTMQRDIFCQKLIKFFRFADLDFLLSEIYFQMIQVKLMKLTYCTIAGHHGPVV